MIIGYLDPWGIRKSYPKKEGFIGSRWGPIPGLMLGFSLQVEDWWKWFCDAPATIQLRGQDW